MLIYVLIQHKDNTWFKSLKAFPAKKKKKKEKKKPS